MCDGGYLKALLRLGTFKYHGGMSENKNVISEEAVEAAHKAWRAQAGTEGTIFEYNLRAALEAAAPCIIREAKADAWDEFERGQWSTNPYRSRA